MALSLRRRVSKKQLAEAIESLPESSSLEEAFERLYRAFKQKLRRDHSNPSMHGRVREGRLKIDEPINLPDDTEVRLALILDGGDELDEEDRARLDEAIRASMAELERGEVFPAHQVLADL